ncbi:MAG: DUF167 domain-containing protein [Deltaproteobacteria bacterium]|jgi:uncharacterized protein (TIGR00251 family)|nr:DUF167 domain-containing protein [Deltaproteobacteria bacterium]
MSSTRLKILVTPRSSREKLLGRQGDELKISLTAPPVEGAANLALAKFLARRLGVAASQVKVVGGQASRHKTVLIDGMEPEEVDKRIKDSLATPSKEPKSTS